MQQAEGQDLVFLLTLYFIGARRGEVFRLTWRDVNFEEGKIRLSDNKAGNGQKRVRWLQMHPELIKALSWWEQARPCKVENVFMQVHCNSHMGEPFRAKAHFMETLCKRAGVEPFGFHAIRHKSAAITFVGSGLNSAQILMGHYRATTTDRYIKSAGLYSDQGEILAALGGSEIGQMVGDLLERKIPQGVVDLEGNCNPEFVTQ
ncbi:tyrosine-type recombinase/integrase [Bilophila wadsworthia]|uniref:tyrosine-type recombinase/integrase n=1 Tax=Bilophila wadsworthia TaxID=35833 RepID=UPI00349EF472